MKTPEEISAYEEAISVSFKGDEWLEKIYIGNKKLDSDFLAAKTKEFLRNGGKIQVIQAGESVLDCDCGTRLEMRKRARMQNKQLFAKPSKGDV